MRLSDFIKRHLGKAIFLFVAGYSLVYAIAFIQLYSMEHPYRLASAWIYENVPPGSKIAAPHWDDKIPVTLPGPGNRVPQIYKMEGREFELPVYEQDNPQNIQLLLRRIAASDYLSFATPRTPDSIPRIENEYPRTTAIIQLLWAEKLGFSLAKTVKNRPSFFGIAFNDDLADESFSVYDHPKAVIFKNEEHLTPEEMWSRVMRVDEYRPLPSMNEMLLMDEGGWKPGPTVWRPEWNAFARTVALLAVLGVSLWAIVVRPSVPLSLVGLFIGLGMVIGAMLAIGANTAALLPFTGAAGRFIALGFFVLALARISLVAKARERFWSSLRQHGVGLLLTVIVTLLIVRAVSSSAFGLSMFGDSDSSNYLGYLVRSESFAPGAVPSAGAVIGVVSVVAWVLKTAAVPFPMLYDVSILVLGIAQACVLYTAFAMLTRKRVATALGATLAAVPVAYLLFGTSTATDAHHVDRARLAPEQAKFVRWAASRIKGAPTFIESCDDSSVKGLVTLAGFSVVDGAAIEGDRPLCAVTDANVAFEAMMKRGVEFFVTPTLKKAASPGSAARLVSFGERRDLFSKLYEDDSFVVFAPAFSQYFQAEAAAG
ncbi:MAG: hypothetical protein RL326_1312 [Pseudomonadota bacterium]|jgi:hypothetical protein